MKEKYKIYLLLFISTCLLCLFTYFAFHGYDEFHQAVSRRIDLVFNTIQILPGSAGLHSKEPQIDSVQGKALESKDFDQSYLEAGNVKVITPQIYGAIGNGIADDTIAMQKAINSLPEGGTLTIPPGKYKCNINITKSNITIIGERGHYRKGSYIEPADLTKPCVQIGNGSDPVRNIKLENLTLMGTNKTEDKKSVGLRINGGSYLYFDDLNVERFGSNNIEVTSGNMPTCYIYFNNMKSEQSHKSNIFADFGKSFVTAFYINNFSNEIGWVKSSRCITLKGNVSLQCTNGWIEAKHYQGIDLYDTSTLDLLNVSIDSANSKDVLVKQFDQEESRVYGVFTLDGKLENRLNITIPYYGLGYFPNYTTLRDPIIQGSIFFVDKYNAYTEEDYKPSFDNRIELKSGKIFFSADGKQFYFDSGTGQLRDFATHGGPTANRPSNPIKYQQYYDNDLKKLIIYDGKEWRDALGNIE